MAKVARHDKVGRPQSMRSDQLSWFLEIRMMMMMTMVMMMMIMMIMIMRDSHGNEYD